MRPTKARRLLALILLLAAAVGCHSDMPFDLVPVHGKVTYDDGSLIQAGSVLVTFSPIGVAVDAKQTPPGAQTNLNVSDGTFSAVTTRRPNDGLLVGRHKVVVVAFNFRPDGRPEPSDAVPPVYRKESTTPLEVEVDADGDQFLEIKISKN